MRMRNIAFTLVASFLLPAACFAMDSEDFEVTEGTTDYLGTPTRSVTIKYKGAETYEGICGADREEGGTMSIASDPRSNTVIISDDKRHKIIFYSSPSSVKWTDQYKIYEYTTN